MMEERIIPTCVGKRTPRGRADSTPMDHPHVRGEKRFRVIRPVGPDGSSPRAWGKGWCSIRLADFYRIIPTCVGKRNSVPLLPRPLSDHPHVRGEKWPCASCPNSMGGSSPRAWGKVRDNNRVKRRRRIIPTCVGKRQVDKVERYDWVDHPHVRGEKMPILSFPSRTAGSSPRAWGKDLGKRFF